jgi:peptidoglycan/LPS O-acetylase OafA/YrhL
VKDAGLEPNLDILRSVAVLAVFLTHTLQVVAGCRYGDRYALGVETQALGTAGVLIFFVHTCLVLLRSLERTGARLSGWALSGTFYIRRAFRIYPLSICLILVSLGFSIPPNALNVPYQWQGVEWVRDNLLLIQNITHAANVASPLWSLPYEVQMYLVLPLLFLALKGPKGSINLASLYIIGALASLSFPILRYVPCFLAGAIAYQSSATVRPRVPAWLWAPAVVACIAAYVEAPGSNLSWGKNVLLSLAVGLCIPLFRSNGGITAAVASHVARYSYGIYLTHTPVLWLVYRVLRIPGWERPALLIVLTGTASMACYHIIERPLIEMGTRLASRLPQTRRGLVPAAIDAGS